MLKQIKRKVRGYKGPPKKRIQELRRRGVEWQFAAMESAVGDLKKQLAAEGKLTAADAGAAAKKTSVRGGIIDVPRKRHFIAVRYAMMRAGIEGEEARIVQRIMKGFLAKQMRRAEFGKGVAADATRRETIEGLRYALGRKKAAIFVRTFDRHIKRMERLGF